jgi:hypothetical protein
MDRKLLIDLRRRLATYAIVGFKTSKWADPSAEHRPLSAAASKVGLKPGGPSSPSLDSR